MAVSQPHRRVVPPGLLDDREVKRQRDEASTAWAFIWILFVFKMATVFMIWWAAQDYEAAILLTATTWFWLGIPAFACAAPFLFRYRLLKVRARRERLRRAEWMLDEPKRRPPRWWGR